MTNSMNERFKSSRRVTFAATDETIEKKQKLYNESDDDTIQYQHINSPDLFAFDLDENVIACSKVQSDIVCFSQKLDEPMSNSSKSLIQSTPTNLFNYSMPFESERINITEVIDALISQESFKSINEELMSSLPSNDWNNVSVDELIQAHSKCHAHIDQLISEAQNSS